MKFREAALSFDERCIYERLLGFKGVFPGTAMAIVEQYSIGEINYVIESAVHPDVSSPGGYITKSLYNKEAAHGRVVSSHNGSQTAHGA